MRGHTPSDASGRSCRSVPGLARLIAARVGLSKPRPSLAAEISGAELRPLLQRGRRGSRCRDMPYDGGGKRAARRMGKLLRRDARREINVWCRRLGGRRQHLRSHAGHGYLRGRSRPRRRCGVHRGSRLRPPGLRPGCGCRNPDRKDKKRRDAKARLQHHTDTHVARTHQRTKWCVGLACASAAACISCGIFHDCLSRIAPRDLACDRHRARRLEGDSARHLRLSRWREAHQYRHHRSGIAASGIEDY